MTVRELSISSIFQHNINELEGEFQYDYLVKLRSLLSQNILDFLLK